ncbi:hypothetical protein [Trinickia sp.]|uniref:hypothetical protein n=1 Tax=Trinickia sp. TaxID=2571163 RepID=UPI003F7F0AE1
MGWTTLSPWRPIPGSGQNITIGASSTQATNAVGDNAQAIQISAIGGNCHVAIGQNPTAGAADMLVKASDPPLVVRVTPGEKIAAIQDGASTGTLNIVEVTH